MLCKTNYGNISFTLKHRLRHQMHQNLFHICKPLFKYEREIKTSASRCTAELRMLM
jgi:hypothetical protein